MQSGISPIFVHVSSHIALLGHFLIFLVFSLGISVSIFVGFDVCFFCFVFFFLKCEKERVLRWMDREVGRIGGWSRGNA